jgi:serralysin
LGRAPDSEGLAFWAGAIDKGSLTRANASLSIMAGALTNTTAQGKLDTSLVNKKVAIGIYFTNALSVAPINGYGGDSAAAQARTMLANVSANTDTSQFQTTALALINSLAASSTPVTAPLPTG